MTKVNIQNWDQLDFLLNNFYEIVEYKRGRGIYGDRVVLKRPKNVENIYNEPGKLYEFYYLDANAVKELPRTIQEKIRFIIKFVISPEDMNVLCDFRTEDGVEPSEWAMDLKNQFIEAKTLDFKVLNDILIENYKRLGANFISKLNKHRQKQYFLASSEEFCFITKDYADSQITRI